MSKAHPAEVDVECFAKAKQLVIEPIAYGMALVNRAQVVADASELFDPSCYEHAKPLREGRGKAYQVSAEFGLAALRHYRRGGLTGALWQDRYPFIGAERTRCFRELRLLAALHLQGLPVPTPLACRFVRSGLMYRADLLTSWLPGALPLSAMVQTISAAIMSDVGKMLRRFHDVNLWHADLNAHNVLLTDNGPALIDFDRCRFRAPNDDWKAANLMRLKRSMLKLGFGARADFVADLWSTLLVGYAHA
jgi:3-deoxy-D-manno-octulosonic acid kinase